MVGVSNMVEGPKITMRMSGGVSINGGDPPNGWFLEFIMDNPIKMDDLGPPFMETTSWTTQKKENQEMLRKLQYEEYCRTVWSVGIHQLWSIWEMLVHVQ